MPAEPVVPAMAGYATIREVYDLEKSLLAAMAAMEARLICKIDETSSEHEKRHAAIDDYLDAEETAAKFRAGQVDAMTLPVRALDAFSRYRWFLGFLLGIGALATGRIEVHVP